MDGRYGYTPEQVGNMTLDQIFFLLCDKSVLRGSERRRTGRYDALSTLSVAPSTADGFIAGRDSKGRPMKAKILGVSKAKRLADAAAERKALEAAQAPQKRKRRRNGN